MEINAREIGQRIRALRMERGLTQQELAYELNVSLSAVSKIEQGKRVPSVDMFALLTDALQTTIDYMVLGR